MSSKLLKILSATLIRTSTSQGVYVESFTLFHKMNNLLKIKPLTALLFLASLHIDFQLSPDPKHLLFR